MKALAAWAVGLCLVHEGESWYGALPNRRHLCRATSCLSGGAPYGAPSRASCRARTAVIMTARKPPRKRWGGVRRRIEEDSSGAGPGDGAGQRPSFNDDEDDEDEQEVLQEGEDDTVKGGASSEKSGRWSMDWLGSLSEQELLALDKKRLMDFLLDDIESDRDWAKIPQQAEFDPAEDVDPKEEIYDEKLTEEIFGKLPTMTAEDDEDEEDAREGDFAFDDDDEDDDLLEDDDDGFLTEGEESDDEELLRQFQEEMSRGKGGRQDARQLLRSLEKESFEGQTATLTAAVKASLQAGDMEAASELLQQMEELGLEVGDLEGTFSGMDSYKISSARQQRSVGPTLSEAASDGGRNGRKGQGGGYRAKEPGATIAESMLSDDEVNAMKAEGACVGIDLGTTNSAVSVVVNGRALVIPSRATGETVVPSVVRFGVEGLEAVGQVARDRATDGDSDNTFTSVKRLIGRSLDELVKEGEILGVVNLVQRDGSTAMYCPALKREVTPEEVSAEVIRTVVADAEAYLGKAVNRAVITVPAYFTPEQCEATERAGRLAGLERVKLLREPEAAALAYGLDKREDELILVFDLGGGTFDVSVLEVGGGMVEVLATFGDNHLGGNDFDKRIADWIAEEFRKQNNGFTLPSDRHVARRLLQAAEDARIKLSTQDLVAIELSSLWDGKGVNTKLHVRAMEQLCEDIFARILVPMRQAALMAGATLAGEVAPESVGGVMRLLAEEEEAEGRTAVDLLEQELEGNGAGDGGSKLAAIMRDRALKGRQASKARSRFNKNLAAVRRMNLGLKIREFPQGRPLDEVVMVGGATRMPCIRRLVEAVTGVRPRATVNPDEAVALGAGIHAGMLDGAITDMEMMTPMQAAMLRGLAEYQMRTQGETTEGEWDGIDDEE